MKKILIFIVVLIATSLISGVAYSKVKGTISGQVTDRSGNGIANVSVSAYDANSDDWTNESQTDSNGNYNLKVPAGTYTVRFIQSSSDGYYAPQWYDNKSNSVVADFVTVKGFRTTSNIDAQLEIGGKISGRVTDSLGKGIANAYVGTYDLYGRWLPGSTTGNNGNYSFNVSAGTYKFHFAPSPSSGYNAPVWYDNRGNLEVADIVTVTAFQTTSDINVQLVTGGKISGRVTDSLGKGIANVNIDAYDPNSNWIGYAFTDINGNYSLNLPVGIYKVSFAPQISSPYYAPGYYDNKSYFQVGDLVTVTAFQTTSNINAQLEIGGAISGRVTDTTGNGIADVGVRTYDPNDDSISFNSATTNSEGFYRIPLAAGSYKVRFSPGPDAGNFVSEWYNNRSDFQSADTVRVRRFIKSTINAQLEP